MLVLENSFFVKPDVVPWYEMMVLSSTNFCALLATFLVEESVSFVSVLNQELNATIVILVFLGKPGFTDEILSWF